MLGLAEEVESILAEKNRWENREKAPRY